MDDLFTKLLTKSWNELCKMCKVCQGEMFVRTALMGDL